VCICVRVRRTTGPYPPCIYIVYIHFIYIRAAAEVQRASESCGCEAMAAPKSLGVRDDARRRSLRGPGKLHGKHGRTDIRKITTTIIYIILYYVALCCSRYIV